MQLPDNLQDGLEGLVADSWNAEPALRPTFEAIAHRIRALVTANAAMASADNEGLHLLLNADSVAEQGNDKRRKSTKEAQSRALELCKAIHDELWHWDERAAVGLIKGEASLTATDPVLNKLVEKEQGVKALSGLAELMTGNMEDGSEIIPDPLLPQDIVINVEESNALLTVRFSVSLARAQSLSSQTGRLKIREDFAGLLEHALAEQAEHLEPEVTPLSAAVEKGDKRALPRKGRARKRKKVKRKLRVGLGKGKKGALDQVFGSFVKAARFVRYGNGVHVLHPSTKLHLFGLMMQAQHGDCRDGVVKNAERRRSSKKAALQSLKQKAWAREKGKKRKKAMEEYIETLTKIAPEWRLANLIAAGSQEDSVAKPKRMMWIIRVDYEELAASSLRASSTIGSRVKLEATAIHIVQASNASQVGLEEGWGQRRGGGRERERERERKRKREREKETERGRKKMRERKK